METPRLVFGEVTVVALENSKQTPAQTLLLSLTHIKALSSIKQLAVTVFSVHVTAALLLLSHPGQGSSPLTALLTVLHSIRGNTSPPHNPSPHTLRSLKVTLTIF